MKRTTVMLTDEADARLRHLAASRGRTVSEVTRDAIDAYVGTRRLRSVGVGDSGRADISARIDEILAEELGAWPERPVVHGDAGR